MIENDLMAFAKGITRYWLYDEDKGLIEEIEDTREQQNAECETEIHASVLPCNAEDEEFEITRMDWVFESETKQLICMLLSDGDLNWQAAWPVPYKGERETIEDIVGCLRLYDYEDGYDYKDEEDG